jgi:hypothetical protein
MDKDQPLKTVPIYQIRELSEQERELGMAFYREHWEGFIDQIWKVRHTLDDIWENGNSDRLPLVDIVQIQTWVEEEKRKSEQTNPFPKGYCFHITSIFEKYLRLKVKTEEIWIITFKDYLAKGGFFRKVWGVDKNQYFQTAMQIGPIILDVSYNTVNLIQAKVEWQVLGHNCIFREVKDLEDYLSIKSSYQGIDSYWNTVFPEIKEEYPIIHFDRNKKVYFLPMDENFKRLAKNKDSQMEKISIIQELEKGQAAQLIKTIEPLKSIDYPRLIFPAIVQKALYNLNRTT